MTNFVYPIMTEPEYQAFRHTIGANFADTYDDWRKIIDHDMEEARRNGDRIIKLELKYYEFTLYCRTTRQNPDPQVLLSFIQKIRRDNQ